MAVGKKRRKAKGTSKPWRVDSGASRHMTNEWKLFTKIGLTNSIVYAVNDGTIAAEGIGTVRVMIKDLKGKAVEMKIHGVLFVPQCKENLLSEGQLDERGMETVTANGKKLIKKNGNLVATAIKQGRYHFRIITRSLAFNSMERGLPASILISSFSRTHIDQLVNSYIGFSGRLYLQI